MSAAVNIARGLQAPRFTAAGFCGKIPGRGDFVRGGLPRSFTEPWDDWLQQVLPASRAILGEAWLPAWLEAPIWRFLMTSGLCGPDPVLGLWLPSVDSVGRHFPLTLAIVAADADRAQLAAAGGGFLAAAEAAGRAALANDLPPAALADRVAAAAAAPPADPGIDPQDYPATGGLWWTAGGPRVPAAAFADEALPAAARFAVMLGASLSAP
jgi:type VI secretion system protein ImpM